jgi:trehalose 6-phosphate phosphatase
VLVPRTEAGRAGLAALIAEPAAGLLALDYDGTLAPIVPRPEDAVPAPGAVDVLARLAPRLPVVLVTGRPADVVVDLGGLADLPGLVVLGQYGVQRWEAGALTQQPPAPGLEVARSALRQILTEPGIELEDKGLSLVVHTRQASDPVAALMRVLPEVADVAARAGLDLHPGRLVLELRPSGSDKGSALESVIEGRSAVLFAGDDLGDIPAFDAVDRLRRKGSRGLTVFSDSTEGPDELRRRADLVVPGPVGVVQLLNELEASL